MNGALMTTLKMLKINALAAASRLRVSRASYQQQLFSGADRILLPTLVQAIVEPVLQRDVHESPDRTPPKRIP